MQTIFRFPVAISQDVKNVESVLDWALDACLLFANVKVGAHQQKLNLSEPKAHFFEGPDTTSKQQLSQLKQASMQAFYDIDVLRMTEPRLLFVQELLSKINALSPPGLTSRCHALRTSQAGRAPTANLSDYFILIIGILLGASKRIDLPSAPFSAQCVFDIEPERIRTVEAASMTGSEALEEILHLLTRIVDTEHDTLTGDIIAFALRDEAIWTMPSSGQPFEVLSVLSRTCNARCDFCYVLGNPSNSAIKLSPFTVEMSSREAEARLRHFERGRSLPVATYDTEEVITHPKFFDTCERIRAATSTPISITTNGYLLSRERIARLAHLKPVDISLSLNAVTDTTRSWLMRGDHQKALECLPLLDEFDIPYAVTIAAWPRVPIEETIAAVRFADLFQPRAISVLLGGYTRLFPNAPDYPIPEFWNEVIEAVRPLRTTLKNPLLLQPRLYEDQYVNGDAGIGRSIVIGVIPGSPASGVIHLYDEIVSINANPIVNRNQCLSLLSLARSSGEELQISVLRRGQELEFVIDPCTQSDTYRYHRIANDFLGIHLQGEDLRTASIRSVFDAVNAHAARDVVVLTSMIVRPFIARWLKKYEFLLASPTSFDLIIPENRFLGGNIVMGDMLVVDDIVACLEEHVAKHGKPDLVILPSGPFNHGGWRRDMKGQSYKLVEAITQLKVSLIESPYFE